MSNEVDSAVRTAKREVLDALEAHATQCEQAWRDAANQASDDDAEASTVSRLWARAHEWHDVVDWARRERGKL